MEAKKRDSEIEQWVLSELRSYERLSPEICVLAQDGVVKLLGSVSDSTSKAAAEAAAYRVAGVADVVNSIRIKPRTAPIRRSLTTQALALPSKPTAPVPFFSGRT
ncbi:MAG: BON domain-containing protein [Pyrinomonadaceae bacterium]